MNLSEEKYPKELKSEKVRNTEVDVEKRGDDLYRATWNGSNHPKFTSTAGSKARFLEILEDVRADDLE